MQIHRDRSEGWTHAKLSGHENEYLVNQLFEDQNFKQQFEKQLGIDEIVSHSIGGLCEENVQCVLGGTTKSKTDLTIVTKSGKQINISIKKSGGGQVYLIRLERFLKGLEAQFGVKTNKQELEALELYFDCKDDLEIENIVEKLNVSNQLQTKLYDYLKRKHRLTADPLDLYRPGYKAIILNWFKSNIDPISRFCFSSGLAVNKKDWADYVWYINLLNDEEWGGLNTIFSIDEFCKNIRTKDSEIYYGTTLGGSTIQLPFGFVQWHQHQPQFNHNFDKLINML